MTRFAGLRTYMVNICVERFGAVHYEESQWEGQANGHQNQTVQQAAYRNYRMTEK